jgi:hypothetical protein
MKRVLLVACVLALVVAPSLLAASRFLHVQPTLVDPGDYVRVNGRGCLPGDTVFLISRPFLGHAFVQGSVATRARANGTFVRFARIRGGAQPGRYAITARCGGANLGVAAHYRVR